MLCPLCGGATDRDPGHVPVQEELSESLAGRPELAHHRPWCPTRRRGRIFQAQDRRVITATEHRTEALRILLPAATLHVPERLASFSAALHLGLALRYGGDPAHIRSTPSTEPDRETGLTRNYLVLYDSLPGGTGYLQRLVEGVGEEFRAVLAAAQEYLRDCPCQDGARRACHLCLLGYAPEREYALLDRREALWMLDDVLGEDGRSRWDVKPVRKDRTGRVEDEEEDRRRFARQAQSDLERRFIDCLDRWLAEPANRADVEHEETPTGRQGKQFTLRRRDGSRIRWESVAQKPLHAQERYRICCCAPSRVRPPRTVCRPCLWPSTWTATGGTRPRRRTGSRGRRQAGPAASRRHAGLADHLGRRHGLGEGAAGRAGRSAATEGDETAQALTPALAGPGARTAWPPYDVEGEASPGGRARDNWERQKQDPGEIDRLFAGAVPALLGFLADPDLRRWRAMARLCVGGLLQLAKRKEVVDALSRGRRAVDRGGAARRRTPVGQRWRSETLSCARRVRSATGVDRRCPGETAGVECAGRFGRPRGGCGW